MFLYIETKFVFLRINLKQLNIIRMQIISEEVYKEMKALVELYELNTPKNVDEQPVYFRIAKVKYKLKYNPDYGDNRLCECGHAYFRHFDGFEGYKAVGCKYCSCNEFREQIKS